ncbi:MAG: caspase family protein [Proteobacteria bacterium]|nr:MAG: caspase family protein [Pseudomonadota bacterium]
MIRWLGWIAISLWLLVGGIAHAEPLRIVVAVGHGTGAAGEARLKYPQGDANRVARLFQELGGTTKEHTILLFDPTAEQLYAAFGKAQAMARTRRPDEVSFVFYFSGHGDRDALHLGSSPVPSSEIRRRAFEVPAALRVIVTDACRTTDSLRAKGMSAEAPFAIKLDDGVGARGLVWLHASGDGEAAQESDQLGSALFTHYWTSGLRGAADRNGDGLVSLSESYEYAYSQTLLRSARSAGVVQRPEAQFELAELTPVTLTRPSASSRIALPRDADTHYLVYATGSRSVVAEAYGDLQKSVELAVAPGRYLVHRRAGGKGSATEIVLARRESRQLTPADFHEVAEERLARKGGELVLRPNEVDVGIGLSYGQFRAPGYGARLGFFHNEGGLGFGARLGAFRGQSQSNTYDLGLLGIDVRALVEYRRRFGRFTVRGGAGPVGALLSQSRKRLDAARLEQAGYATSDDKSAVAFGGTVFAGARLRLGGVFYTELGLSLDVLGARLDAASTTSAPDGGTRVRPLASGHADLAAGVTF